VTAKLYVRAQTNFCIRIFLKFGVSNQQIVGVPFNIMGFVKVGSGKEGRSVSWALLKLLLCLVKRYDRHFERKERLGEVCVLRLGLD
jgi:hypothetical protein